MHILPPMSPEASKQLRLLKSYSESRYHAQMKIAKSAFNNLPNHYDHLTEQHPDRVSLMDEYVYDGSKDINMAFIKPNYLQHDDPYAFLDMLHNTKRHNNPITVFSGIGPVRTSLLSHSIENGSPLHFDAPTSTSTSAYIASSFAQKGPRPGIILALHIKPHLPFFAFKSADPENSREEFEVILPPFTVPKYKTHKILSYGDDMTLVHGLYEPHDINGVRKRLDKLHGQQA